MAEIGDTELGRFLAEKRGRAAELARRCEVSAPVVHDWATGARPVPAAHCPTVEEFTGIPCERLQPAVRWYVLRNGALPMGTSPAFEVCAADPGQSANDEPQGDQLA